MILFVLLFIIIAPILKVLCQEFSIYNLNSILFDLEKNILLFLFPEEQEK